MKMWVKIAEILKMHSQYIMVLPKAQFLSQAILCCFAESSFPETVVMEPLTS